MRSWKAGIRLLAPLVCHTIIPAGALCRYKLSTRVLTNYYTNKGIAALRPQGSHLHAHIALHTEGAKKLLPLYPLRWMVFTTLCPNSKLYNSSYMNIY